MISPKIDIGTKLGVITMSKKILDLMEIADHNRTNNTFKNVFILKKIPFTVLENRKP